MAKLKRWNWLVNKTIAKAYSTQANCVVIEFTDGSKMHIGLGDYLNIYEKGEGS